MKKLLTLTLLVFPLILFSQTSPQKGFSTAKEDRSRLHLLVMHAKSSVGSSDNKTPTEMGVIFDNFIDTLSDKRSKVFLYKDFIHNVYSNLYTSAKTSYYLKNETGEPQIFTYDNGSDVIIFNNIMYTSVFNTIKMGERDRAKNILVEVALPIIQDIANDIPSNVKYIGLCIAYGSKDFTNEYAFPDGDCLVAVVQSGIAKKYLSLEITEDDLIDKCDIYLSTKDFYSKIKKIKIAL